MFFQRKCVEFCIEVMLKTDALFYGKFNSKCKNGGGGTKKEVNFCSSLLFAVRTGLEPVTPCVTGMYSNQLN